MNNKLIGSIIMIAITIIMTATLLMPVLNEAERGYETAEFSNAGGWGAEKITSATIELDISDSLTYNGAAWNVGSGKIPMLITENYLFQINAGSLSSNDLIYCDESGPSRATVKTMSLELANGNLDLTYTDTSDVETTTTIPCTWAYIITSTDAKEYMAYNLYGTSKSVYCNSVKDFNAVGYYMNGSSIEKVYSANNGAAMINNVDTTVTLNGFTEVSGYNDVYSGTITYTNGFAVVDGESVAYPWFVVLPTEITGYVEPDHTYTSLLSALPIMIIVSIVVGAVALISRRE